MSFTRFEVQQLTNFVEHVFRRCKVPPKHAQMAASVLIWADEHGIDSHGVPRLRTYVEMLQAEHINPTPKVKIRREKHSVASVDGDNGLGLVVAQQANDLAREKCGAHGSGFVSLFNSNHCGAMGFYALQTLEKSHNSMLAWCGTNTSPIVAPFNGYERMLGTNPIAFAFPGRAAPPIVADFATSTVAYGKVEIAARHGQQCPNDAWILAADGAHTREPAALLARGGALQPLGGAAKASGGHKGYCMGVVVDLLSSLAGANYLHYAPPFSLAIPAVEGVSGARGAGIGQFFGAMDLEAFGELDEVRGRVDDYRATLLRARPRSGGGDSGEAAAVILPGDEERAAAAERRKHGIPLVKAVVDDLRILSKELSVPL